MTRSLPGFKAAARAPSERRISPALRFHYRKFLLIGALWLMGQGSRRDIACLWEQRRTQFGGHIYRLQLVGDRRRKMGQESPFVG